MKLAAILMTLTLLVGCNTVNAEQVTTQEQIVTQSVMQNSPIRLKDEDSYTDWRQGTYKEIALGNESVTITNAGTYVLSGQLKDGQIVVNADSKDTVRLVLNGVQIESKDKAPIYIENADKVILSLEEGTENILIDNASNNEEQDAVIYAKDDLTINGKGSLLIEANNKHGISCNNELVIMEGHLNILAVGDGIHVKEDTLIQSGELTIEAEQDAIQSDLTLEVLGGTFDLISGGGSENGKTHTSEFGGPPIPKGEENKVPSDRPELPPEALSGEERPELPPEAEAGEERPELPPEAKAGEKRPELSPEAKAGEEQPELSPQVTTEESVVDTSETTISMKGIKAGEAIWLQGGSFKINAADDGIHSNGDIMIHNGEFTIETGDDGIHSDTALTIHNGTINITKSYEGLEAAVITINEGNIKLKATDDGINATEGQTEEAQEMMHSNPEAGNAKLIINGGMILVDAEGDGLDSNGTITMNGGTVYVEGPTNGGNGALDYDKTCDVHEGTLIAVGAIQMAQSISESSSQNALDISFSEVQQAGKTVEILDKDGTKLLEYTPNKKFQSMIISSPLLKTGETYQYVYDQNVITEFTIEQKNTYLNETGITTERTNNRQQRMKTNEKKREKSITS